MKKIMLMLSLMVIGLFLVSCAPQDGAEDAALAGEAVKVGGKTIRLNCKEFGNPTITTTGNAFCKEQGYDTCTGGSIWVTANFYKDSDLKIYDYKKRVYFTIPCELNFVGDENWGIKSWEDYENIIVKAVVGDNPTLNYKSGASDGIITCCRVR